MLGLNSRLRFYSMTKTIILTNTADTNLMKALFILSFALSVFLTTKSYASTLKIATLSPDGSQWMITMKKAAKEVETATEGRVKFRFYPGGVMGSDEAVLKKMRFGQLHGAAVPGGALSKFAPNTQVYNLPLLFSSYEEVDYVRNKLDAKISAAYEAAGFVNFGLAEGGFAYLMAKNAEIASPADLQKHKVWVPSNDPASQSAAKTFEIAPIPLTLGDVLAGLQTGLVDTVTSSPIGTIALQWHTQVTSITDMPLVYFYGVLAISEKAFNKINSEDQTIVRRIMSDAFKKIDAQNRKDNESAFAALKAQGIKLIKPDQQQMSSWQEKTNASISNYLKEGGISEAAFNEVIAVLAEAKK